MILDRSLYIAEAESQLSNADFYVTLDPASPPLNTKSLLLRELNSLFDKKILARSQFNFLCNSVDSSSNRLFYTLPKIHKPRSSWFDPKTPPGRPIVSDVSSPTYQIGKYISKALEPLATKHPSYIRDTYHFLDQLGSMRFPDNCALVTLDVKSLYTNIDNVKGIKAVARAMRLHPDIDRPDTELLRLLSICLNHNTFSFNGKSYRQNNGCAMGHPYAVHYANIYMALLEKDVLASCPLSPLFYVRFIDDIFLIWQHGFDAFKDFLLLFNSRDDSIQLTYDYNVYSITFLDVYIYKGLRFLQDGIFDSSVFFKPTDTHQLLHKKSFHPRHTFASIVKSQVLRFYRLCNNLFDFDIACQTLFTVLKTRGYSSRMLRRIKLEIVSENGHIRPSRAIGSISRCGQPRCLKCSYILQDINPVINGQTFYISDDLNCNSEGVIYTIVCVKCQLFYIGETQNKLRYRINQHLSSITTKRETLIAVHFNSSGHDVTTHFRFAPLKLEGNQKYRRHLESRFIHRFQTFEPLGLNERADNIDRSNAIIPIILPYGRDSATVGKKLKDSAARHEVCDEKFIMAFTRHRNLKSILAPSKID